MRWNDTQTTTNEEWYMYDASGNRVLKRSATGTGTSNTKIILYPFGLQEHTYDGAGTLQFSKYYYRLGGHLVGKSDGSATSFFVTDALGSVLANFSAKVGSAALLGNQTYGPYGSSQYQKGTLGTSKGFTGQYNDALTTLDYYGSRYYDPAVGVFLSAESVLGNGAGENPYAYVGGNPETYSDPSGLLACNETGSICQVPLPPPIGGPWNALQPCNLPACGIAPTHPSAGGTAQALVPFNTFAIHHTVVTMRPSNGSPAGGLSSCGTPGPSQPTCGIFQANFAVYLSTGGEIGVPGPWCVWCGSGGGSNNSGESGGFRDLTNELASDTEGEIVGDASAASDLGGEPSDAAALEIPWSSKTVRQAAEALNAGDTEVIVANRSEAEELFLRKYQGRGYTNTTGLSGPETKDLFGSKYGTYHWDDVFDPEGRIQGHGPDNPHGNLPHLQIQPFGDEESQDIIRIFFWPW